MQELKNGFAIEKKEHAAYGTTIATSGAVCKHPQVNLLTALTKPEYPFRQWHEKQGPVPVDGPDRPPHTHKDFRDAGNLMNLVDWLN